jgi:hypothetical protein
MQKITLKIDNYQTKESYYWTGKSPFFNCRVTIFFSCFLEPSPKVAKTMTKNIQLIDLFTLWVVRIS